MGNMDPWQRIVAEEVLVHTWFANGEVFFFEY